jgi:hypothetical protein
VCYVVSFGYCRADRKGLLRLAVGVSDGAAAAGCKRRILLVGDPVGLELGQ